MSTTAGAASASSRRGWLPFRVAMVIVVVGLLIVTCGSLIAYVLYRGEYSVALLKRAYLEQVADTAVGEVVRLPTTAVQVLRVQRYRLETGYYSTTDAVAVAQALAGALQADPDMQWFSYSEEATGRFMGAHRIRDDEVVLNLSDPRQNRGAPHELRAATLEPYVRTPPLTAPYDPRTREWYQRTMAAPPDTIVWMPPCTFAEGVQGIAAAPADRPWGRRVGDTGWQSDRAVSARGRTDGSRPLHRGRLGHPGENRGVYPSGQGNDILVIMGGAREVMRAILPEKGTL